MRTKGCGLAVGGLALLFTLTGVLAACKSQTRRATDRIVRAALEGDGRHAYASLEELTDRVGPRLSGSPNLEAAVRWAAAALARAGADRVWTERVLVPHWVRGAESAIVTDSVEQRRSEEHTSELQSR